MALIDFGTAPNTATGDTLYDAFTKINNMFSTTTKLTSGDLSIGRDGGITVGKGGISGGSYGGTALGQDALLNTTSGLDNTAVGWSVLKSNTVGNYNTAVGSNAMINASGSNANSNTGIGAGVLNKTTGGNNSALGFNALANNTSGYGNTAVGYGTLPNNQSGTESVAVGNLALQNNTTGSQNVGLGTGALFQNQIRSNNTAVGANALYFNTLWTNCTGLGYNSNVSDNNQIRLGDTSITAVVSQVGSFSDIRDKADVRDTVLGLDFVNSLRPVDYKWDYREDYRPEMPTPLELDATEEEKDAHKIMMDEWLESCKLSNLVKDGSKKRTRYHHGLIAQEVQEVIESSGVDFGGFQDHTIGGGDDVMTVSYMELIAPMIKAIQELTARINVLEGN